MNGKEILLSALRGQAVPRVPWLPFVGVHGGSLIGATASDYLRDSQKLYAGLKHAHEAYQPDALPVAFDLQIEAEILGCKLRWSDDSPPAVCSHPLLDSMDLSVLPGFDPNGGRLPVVLEALRQLKAEIGETVALYGLITGPFTLGLHLRGDDIFLDMYDAEDDVDVLLRHCAQVGQVTAQAYLEAGADVVAVVDPMVSQISPEHFERFVSSPLNDVFDAVHAGGGLASLFVCGDATRNLPAMCQTRCDNLSVDENVSLAALRAIATKAGKSFGGNLRLTTALLLGNELESQRDALRCYDEGGATGFILAPGCDLPYATPEANLRAVAALVHNPYQRDVARTAAEAAPEDPFEDIDLPDYDRSGRVIVDVVTLDSGSCAPCQYMLQAAQQAASEAGDHVQVREHKIKERAGLGYMKKLNVTAIPSICIQGREQFASIIPDRPRLVAAIRSVGDPTHAWER
ncbi:MAG: uroporphyrinogen decarboxylase family protein [Opitutales bacterium]